MAKMKDRLMRPPYGWQFHQPQTGYSIPDPDNKSFEDAVRLVIEHRRGNPWIVQQHNLSLDESVVGDEIDSFNAERMRNNPAWIHFLSDASPGPSRWPQRLNRAAAGVVASVKKTAAGVKIISDWLGSGLRPVDKALANKRAAVCVACPLNQEGGFWEKLDAAGAEEVKTLMKIKSDMELKTDYDDKLKSCTACLCHNPLKVWTPLQHITNNMSMEVEKALHNECWVLAEKYKK